MVKISESELAAVLETAERVAKRTGNKVVLRWGRIIITQQLKPTEEKQ